MSAVCCVSQGSFTETWLHSHILDHSVAVPSFSTVRADRDVTSSGKKKGGIALYVSERWCNPGHVHVKERLCSPDIELLTVGMWPYFLPQEFMSAIIICVYVPPSADAAVACDVIHSTLGQIQTQHPNPLLSSLGILIMSHWTKPSQHFTSMLTAPPETVTHWICCMQM